MSLSWASYHKSCKQWAPIKISVFCIEPWLRCWWWQTSSSARWRACPAGPAPYLWHQDDWYMACSLMFSDDSFCWGGAYFPPLPHICVYLCKYTYKRVEKNWLFPIISLEKGSTPFSPIKISLFAEKKWSSSEAPEFQKVGPLRGGLSDQWKIRKVNHFFGGGSGHPNFMNPFEYGKTFIDKLFPKRFGTLTQTKPYIHRGDRGGGRYAPRLSLDTLK